MALIRSTVAGLALSASLAIVGCRPRSAAPVTRPDPALAAGITLADSLIENAVGSLVPGAVFLVSRNGDVVHERAFGYAQINDYYERMQVATMRTNTMFDLA